jgi:hypothetical protein
MTILFGDEVGFSTGDIAASLQQSCHLDRTRISCHAPDVAGCAAFGKESSMKCANATKFYRKSGGAQRSGEICGLFSVPRLCGPTKVVFLIQSKN